ncbi:MAG: hypothetical protein JNJ69_03870 [Leptospiraceae bacterium]|nr:hypothetical protein [Leptospiraceae bacterium]
MSWRRIRDLPALPLAHLMGKGVAKNYLYSALALAFAVLCLFAERLTIIYRIGDLAGKRLEALQADVENLDNLVEARIREGVFFKYLIVKPLPPAEQTELNLNPQLIESALILDRQFATLARSGRDLESAERSQLKDRRVRGILTDRVVLRRYDVTDFDKKRTGYLVLVLRPDLRHTQAGLVAANFNFSVVTDFSRDRFDREDKQLVSVLLSKQSGVQNLITVRGKTYLTVRHTWLSENLILFQIAEMPPLYTYLSLYFLLIVLLASMVFIIYGHAGNRYTRREVSERILREYDRAVESRQQAVSELSTVASIGETLAEKIVNAEPAASTALSLEQRLAEARAAEARRREKQEQAPIVIDMMPENRQFRFMNPSLTLRPQQRVAQLSEQDHKLRHRAFSDELKGLMAAVTAPPASERPSAAPTGLLTEISAFEDSHRYPAIDQYLYYLNELYFDEVTEAELAEAMRVAGDAVQSGVFAILLYDSSQAVFRTGFTHGTPALLHESLFLLPRDSVLPNEYTDYGYITITPVLRKNPYFLKRFPAGFTDDLKGFHIFNIHESYLKARIVFFDSDRGAEVTDTETLRRVKSYLRQIAPAIHMFFLETAEDKKGEPADLADWAVHELKECVSLADEEHGSFISQYVFESSLDLGVQLTMLREIARILRDGEKVLVLSPSRFVVVHRAAEGAAIEEILSRQGKKFIIKESEFGKVSRNLYTFIEF